MFILPGMSVDLMARVAGMLTPVPARIAGPLLGGMRSDSVVHNGAASRDFPQIEPVDYETSVRQALEHLSPGSLEMGWEKGAASFRTKQEGFFIEGRQIQIDALPEAAYHTITGLGGRNGWLYLNGLWKLRGFFDWLIGGPGLREPRTTAALVEGDILDFYRVEALEPNRLVRLRAELKAPGLGWMEWRIRLRPQGGVALTQIAYFAPTGLPGYLYWYLLLPVHRLVFAGLIKAIARRAAETQNALPRRRHAKTNIPGKGP